MVLSKITSDPNMYGSGSKSSRGNKAFAPVKRSSVTGPTTSYKLSSKVKSMLSHDLKVHTNGGCGDDSSIQSSNSRRRFQRRGSKAPSMFKNFSASSLNIPEALFEGVHREPLKQSPSPMTPNNAIIRRVLEIPKDSTRSFMSTCTMGDSSRSLNCDDMSEEFGCGWTNGILHQ